MRSGIVYAKHDGVELQGDLYAPAGGGPFPAVVAAPGGGWFVCDRAGMKQWGEFLARNGIAAFVVQYRVAMAEKTFPQSACDVLAAIQFVRGSASELGIDPARIGILGSSAGAHVGALAALAGDNPLFKNRNPANGHGGVDPAIKTFAGIYGPYDLFAHWQHEIADSSNASGRRSECFLGVPPFADRQLYFDASPINHVRYATNKIPMFVAYGTEDSVVDPETQSVRFARVLKQAGHYVVSVPVVGATHFWFSEDPIDEPGSYSAHLAPRLLRFLKRHL